MSKTNKAQNNYKKYVKLFAILMTFALYAASVLYATHRVDDITSWFWDKMHTDITLPWKLIEFRLRLIAINLFICILIVCSYVCILSPIETGEKTSHKIIVSPEEMR